MLYFRSAQKKGGERLSSLPSLVSYAHVSKRTPGVQSGVLLKIFSPQAGCLGGDFRAGSTMAATGDAATGDGRAGRAKHSFIPSSLPCLPVRVQVLPAGSAVTARQARRNFPVVLRPDNPGDGGVASRVNALFWRRLPPSRPQQSCRFAPTPKYPGE